MNWREIFREAILPTTICEGVVLAVIIGFLVWL